MEIPFYLSSIYLFCGQMLNQLNATLEEENKALVEQVNKLVEQVNMRGSGLQISESL